MDGGLDTPIQSSAISPKILTPRPAAGVPPPEAFRLLCKWRNGQRAMLFESFQNNCMVSALEDIVTAKAILA